MELSIHVVEVITVKDIVGKIFELVKEGIKYLYDNIWVMSAAQEETPKENSPPDLGVNVNEVIHHGESL